ncbi:MAG: DUF5615 family PIN-like protein [Planctomycetes bacterium]|nr:DUF5615 family PIN-like protein [Planctomycetota bacterium]
MRIKLDENMPADLSNLLLAEGHDVRMVTDEGLGGEDDTPVIQAAAAEARILMTFDLDFADVRQYPPGKHAGVVVFRLRDQRWRSLEPPVRRLLATAALEKLDQGLAIVDESRVRYRRPKRKDSP